MRITIGIAILVSLAGHTNAQHENDPYVDTDQRLPIDTATDTTPVTGDEIETAPEDSTIDVPIDEAEILTIDETVIEPRPIPMARRPEPSFRNPESEAELEMLKMINSRLRDEVEGKSRVIQAASERDQVYVLFAGAAILLFGGVIGFFFGFRVSRKDLHL